MSDKKIKPICGLTGGMNLGSTYLNKSDDIFRDMSPRPLPVLPVIPSVELLMPNQLYIWDTRPIGAIVVVQLNEDGNGICRVEEPSSQWYFEDNLVGVFYGGFQLPYDGLESGL